MSLNKSEKYLIENLNRISNEGCVDENPRPKWKDGTLAHSIFITPVFETYDLANGELPITELRPIVFENAIKEINWIYVMQSNSLQDLRDEHGIKWWDDFNVGDGTIGQRYGATVRKHKLIDNLLNGIKSDPFGRRNILSLWQNEDFIKTGGLNPCCFMSMFTVRKIKTEFYLDMTLTCRSSDYLVAGHVNRIQYVAFQMMVAKHCSMRVGQFNIFVQNLHIYDRHLEQAEEMMKRVDILKQREKQSQPKLTLNVPDGTSFYDIKPSDFTLDDYYPITPQLKFQLAI